MCRKYSHDKRPLRRIPLFFIIQTILTAIGLACCVKLSQNSGGPSIQSIVCFVVFIMLYLICIYVYLVKIVQPLEEIDQAVRMIRSHDSGAGQPVPVQQIRNVYANELITLMQQLEEANNKAYSERILFKQAELAALQSQINPHFLYNTLECIRGLALLENMVQIAEMTEALSTLFRYSISTGDNLVTLMDGLNNVRDYFTIQRYRFDNKFTLDIIYDSEEHSFVDNCLLPKLTLQPIVENSIFHGLETREGTGKVVIRVISTERRLLLIVEDNGSGMDRTLVEHLNLQLRGGDTACVLDEDYHSGIALTNVNERIRLYFGNTYGVSVSSTKGMGTDVSIVLPIVTKNENNPIPEMDRFQ